MQLVKKEQKRLYENYGPVALVTGASSGIGKEISFQLAEAGFDLILNGRNQKALEEIQTEMLKNNIKVDIISSDLSESQNVGNLIDRCQKRRIGLFVASAGYGTSGPFIENSIHEEINMLRVNCEALLELTHHFARLFAQNRKGGIILLSSMVAFQGVPYSSNYAASKAYVQSLAEGLTLELKDYNVDVLAAAPGPVKSGFAKRADMKMNRSLRPDQVGVPILRALGRKHNVIPGNLSKLLVYSLRTIPRTIRVRIMKKIMGGMTHHQRHNSKVRYVYE